MYKIIGLSNHKIFDLLNKLFKETLPKHFDNPEAKSALEEAKKKQKFATNLAAGIFVIGVFSIFIVSNINKNSYEDKSALTVIPWLIDGIGLFVGIYLSSKAKTSEMKDFEKVYSQAISDINSINININDFNLNLIGSENNNNNNNSLGN